MPIRRQGPEPPGQLAIRPMPPSTMPSCASSSGHGRDTARRLRSARPAGPASGHAYASGRALHLAPQDPAHQSTASSTAPIRINRNSRRAPRAVHRGRGGRAHAGLLPAQLYRGSVPELGHHPLARLHDGAASSWWPGPCVRCTTFGAISTSRRSPEADPRLLEASRAPCRPAQHSMSSFRAEQGINRRPAAGTRLMALSTRPQQSRMVGRLAIASIRNDGPTFGLEQRNGRLPRQVRLMTPSPPRGPLRPRGVQLDPYTYAPLWWSTSRVCHWSSTQLFCVGAEPITTGSLLERNEKVAPLQVGWKFRPGD